MNNTDDLHTPHAIPSLMILKWAVWLGIIATIAPILWMWLLPDSFVTWGGDDIVMRYGGFDRLLWWQRLLGILITGTPAAILVAAFRQVLLLVGFAQAGNWFDAACERHLIATGKLMLWQVFAGWISSTLLILVLTATYPDGKHELAIRLGSGEIYGLIPALMALVLAHMVRAGRAQRDELNEII